MTRVLTIGTFDTPHLGHAHFFLQCESFGDLIVGINSDEFVEKYKGEKPLFSYQERRELIELLGYETRINESAGKDLIYRVCPDILVIGSDWARKDYLKQIGMTQDELDERGITLVYVPYTKGISTTEIKKRINESNSNSYWPRKGKMVDGGLVFSGLFPPIPCDCPICLSVRAGQDPPYL